VRCIFVAKIKKKISFVLMQFVSRLL